jgi:hypothetical protein
MQQQQQGFAMSSHLPGSGGNGIGIPASGGGAHQQASGQMPQLEDQYDMDSFSIANQMSMSVLDSLDFD